MLIGDHDDGWELQAMVEVFGWWCYCLLLLSMGAETVVGTCVVVVGGDQPLTTLSLSSSPIISVVFLWVICGLFLHLPTYNVNASQMNDQFMTDHNIFFLGIKKVN